MKILPTVLSVFLAGTTLGQSMVTQKDIDVMRGYFEANIGINKWYDDQWPHSGCVIASPSYVDPNYLFHWMRDAAISMNVLRETANSSRDFDPAFQKYVQWVTNAQTRTDPNGINVLGEPKFFVNGEVYSGGWCRPQDDGPASRSMALANYALWLIANGRANDVLQMGIYQPLDCGSQAYDRLDCGYVGINEQQCRAKGCCWDPVSPNPWDYPWCFHGKNEAKSLITTDVNYVSSVWRQPSRSCDLWEEVRGAAFYTYMVQHKSFLRAAKVAQYFGDLAVAKHWNDSAQQICSASQQFEVNGFISENNREFDCSVILGALYGGQRGCFGATDWNVLSTAARIREYYASALPVNNADDILGIPGTLIGRYKDDAYSGCASNGGRVGNAWILCSNALGDLYYRNAIHLQQTARGGEWQLEREVGHRKLEAVAFNAERDLPKAAAKLRQFASRWKKGTLSAAEKAKGTRLAARLMAAGGDAQLTRVKYHAQGCDLHLAEQICLGSGEEVGAFDLTWSYGTMLSAWRYRASALRTGVRPLPFEKQPLKGKLPSSSCPTACRGQDDAGTCCVGQCNE